MSGALNRHPLGVDAAVAGTKGLPIGRVRIGPSVSRAVHDQQPTGVREQVGVVSRPPWCQRDHRADVAARRQVGGHSPAHRVTDYHDLGGVEVRAHRGEGDLCNLPARPARRCSSRGPGIAPAARVHRCRAGVAVNGPTIRRAGWSIAAGETWQCSPAFPPEVPTRRRGTCRQLALQSHRFEHCGGIPARVPTNRIKALPMGR